MFIRSTQLSCAEPALVLRGCAFGPPLKCVASLLCQCCNVYVIARLSGSYIECITWNVSSCDDKHSPESTYLHENLSVGELLKGRHPARGPEAVEQREQGILLAARHGVRGAARRVSVPLGLECMR